MSSESGKKIEHFFNDVWVEKGYPDPLAVITFKFTSEEAFTTNHPINVKVTILITKGFQNELLPLEIIFPDAFKYPQEITSPSGTPTAGIVKIRESPPYEGETIIEFTQPGSYGYIIFSKGRPRYFAAERKIITVSSYDTRAILNKIEKKGSGQMIQEIHGNVYGNVVQAKDLQVTIQQISDAFKEARSLTEAKIDISPDLKKEVKETLLTLEEELKKKEPNAGKIQKSWQWLKRNANWVVPSLTQIIIEALKSFC